jgi:hypothetical protein
VAADAGVHGEAEAVLLAGIEREEFGLTRMLAGLRRNASAEGNGHGPGQLLESRLEGLTQGCTGRCLRHRLKLTTAVFGHV